MDTEDSEGYCQADLVCLKERRCIINVGQVRRDPKSPSADATIPFYIQQRARIAEFVFHMIKQLPTGKVYLNAPERQGPALQHTL